MKRNLILVGMPGSGKTTIGGLLAERLGLQFVDTDSEIVKQEKVEIAEIFKMRGEDYFREIETRVIRDLLGKENIILSTGGGSFQKKMNRTLLAELGCVIYLKTSPKTIYDRIKDDTSRPLLLCANPFEKIEELYQQRHENFELADIIIDTADKQPLEILEEILRTIDGKTIRD